MRALKISLLIVAFILMIGGNVYSYTWFPYNGHKYTLTNTVGNWGPCEAEAVLAGGHLVTINNAAEEAWLISTFGNTRYWIGFTDQAQEGTWVWIAGDGGYWKSGDPGSTSYVNWAPGEPNNMTPPAWGEDYAVMNWSGGKWNDFDSNRPENYTYRGVIEVVPLPGALWLLGSGLLGLARLRWRR